MKTLTEFIVEYRAFNPEPVKVKVKRPYQYIVFWPFLIVAVGTLMMSGIRTFETFGTGAGGTLLVVESLLAVLAVEVGMGGNITKLASYRKNKRILKKQEPKLAIAFMVVAGFLSIIIALFTNMVQVLFRLGLDTPQLINLVNVISVFLKGGVIPILGILNLEIVAYYFAKYDWDNEIANRDYSADMTRWRKAAEKTYQSGKGITKTEFKYRNLPELDPIAEISSATIHSEIPTSPVIPTPDKDNPINVKLPDVSDWTAPKETVTIPLPKGKKKITPAPKKKKDNKGATASTRRTRIRKAVEDGEKFNSLVKKALAEEFGVSIQTIEEDIDKANAEKYDPTVSGMF